MAGYDYYYIAATVPWRRDHIASWGYWGVSG